MPTYPSVPAFDHFCRSPPLPQPSSRTLTSGVVSPSRRPNRPIRTDLIQLLKRLRPMMGESVRATRSVFGRALSGSKGSSRESQSARRKLYPGRTDNDLRRSAGPLRAIASVLPRRRREVRPCPSRVVCALDCRHRHSRAHRRLPVPVWTEARPEAAEVTPALRWQMMALCPRRTAG